MLCYTLTFYNHPQSLQNPVLNTSQENPRASNPTIQKFIIHLLHHAKLPELGFLSKSPQESTPLLKMISNAKAKYSLRKLSTII